MEHFWAYVEELGRGEAQVCQARYMTEEEQQKWRASLRATGMLMLADGPRHRFLHPGSGRSVRLKDLPTADRISGSRRADGWMPGSNNGVWILTEAEAQAILAEYEALCAAWRDQEAKAARESIEARAATFALAKATGERQYLRQDMVECNDRAVDCSLDVLTLWAMPDGSTKTTRTHTH